MWCSDTMAPAASYPLCCCIKRWGCVRGYIGTQLRWEETRKGWREEETGRRTGRDRKERSLIPFWPPAGLQPNIRSNTNKVLLFIFYIFVPNICTYFYFPQIIPNLLFPSVLLSLFSFTTGYQIKAGSPSGKEIWINPFLFPPFNFLSARKGNQRKTMQKFRVNPICLVIQIHLILFPLHKLWKCTIVNIHLICLLLAD